MSDVPGPLASPDGDQRGTSGFSRALTVAATEASISDAVHRSITRAADQIALLTRSDSPTTYGDLGRAVDAWAGVLPAGVRVALAPRSTVSSIAALLGAWSVGSSVVLLHRHLTVTQRSAAIEGSRAAALIEDDAVRSTVSGTSQPAPPGELLVGLTSGSTAAPKLFARSHASWMATFRRSDWLFDIPEDRSVAIPGAIDHSHFLYGVVHGLVRGATVDLGGVNGTRWERSGVLYSVPTLAADLVELDFRLPTLSVVLSSGAAWAPGARERFRRLLRPECRVLDFYGAGELSFVSVSEDDSYSAQGCVGRPFPGVRVRVRRDDGVGAAPGESGVLDVSSDMLFTGYLDAEGRVAHESGGWVTVGDRGFLDADGRLFLSGRKSRMFTRGGLNVEPEAVERVLSTHPSVRAAACMPRQDERWGAVPVAIVELRQAVSVAELRRWCAERLDVVHRPNNFEMVDALPVTHRGKIDHRALQRLVDRLDR